MRVLVIAPHPDDETLGCGGTILKHRANGDAVYWLIMTNMLVEEGYDAGTVQDRQNEIDIVAQCGYGFEEYFKLDLPTTKLDTIPMNKMVKSVSNIIQKVKPNAVYLPHRNDIHLDHRIVFDVAINSVKTFRSPFINRVLMYEVVSETEFAPPIQGNTFAPNSFSDITYYIDDKIKIMGIYKGEIEDHPFPRSVENIKALAAFRGATAGVRYAESFVMLKEIW